MWKAGPRGRAGPLPAAQTGQELFLEWYGGGVALSHHGDQPYLVWYLLSAVAEPSEDVVIRYTAAAARHPSVGGVLRDAITMAGRVLDRRGSSGRIRLGPLDTEPVGLAPHLLARLGAAAGSRLETDAQTRPGRPPAALAEGWRRLSDRLYQFGPSGSALAEVLPAGILLRPERVFTPGAVAMVEPVDSRIVVGSRARPVPPELVAMLRRVLPVGRAIDLRLDIVGEMDPVVSQRLADLCAEIGLDVGPQWTPPPGSASPHRVGSAEEAAPPPDGPAPARPLVASHSRGGSLAGEGGYPDAPRRPGPAAAAPGTGDSLAERTASDRPEDAAQASPPGPAAPVPCEGGPGPVAPPPRAAPPVVTMADPDEADPVVVTVETATGTGGVEPSPRWQPVVAGEVGERASTVDEQQRFITALGGRFTDLLAVVNGALASWPVLRRDGSAGSKADFVAVCLYLGDSEEGAVRLNAALRDGQPVTVEGYLPCLVSGFRQLPLHRRALVRQACLGHPAATLYPVGSVLVEPAFLSASAAADVTVRGADVDFLIWPRTARQAYVLEPGRPVDEAVFGAGSRFKVLAVQTEPARSDEGAGGGLVLPDTTVLLRELLPHERPVGAELDETDRIALGRLDAALRQRRAQPPRPIDEPDLAARLGAWPPGYAAATTAIGVAP